jgi:hypothetical protein
MAQRLLITLRQLPERDRPQRDDMIVSLQLSDGGCHIPQSAFRISAIPLRTWITLSPYGFPLEIRYPKVDLDALFSGIKTATKSWRSADPETWVGVALEILHRTPALSARDSRSSVSAIFVVNGHSQ